MSGILAHVLHVFIFIYRNKGTKKGVHLHFRDEETEARRDEVIYSGHRAGEEQSQYLDSDRWLQSACSQTLAHNAPRSG